MRVLFTTFAAKPHLYSMVPLAWALHTAGHEVRVASQPDLVDEITRASLIAVPIGEELKLEESYEELHEELDSDESFESLGIDISETRAEKLTWEYTLGVSTVYSSLVLPSMTDDRTIDDIVKFARQWRPDLVVWDPLTFSGAVAAKVTGAAHARMLFGLDFMANMRTAFTRLLERRPPELRDDPLREWLTPILARFGCDFTEDMAVGQWTIDTMPSWLRLPVDLDYVPMRFVPYHGQSSVPDWVHRRPARTRVCLTLGVSGREVIGGDTLPVADMIKAVEGLDVEVVATLTAEQVEQVPEIPQNVRLVDFVPLNVLLPTCSAIIHHGGQGAFGTALATGVPQLIVPNQDDWDTYAKARESAGRGIGLFVDPGELTAATLRSSLLRLLDEPEFREKAERDRRGLLAIPNPNDIVAELEERTARHGAR
ncbi:activator-dependent family glycosyltransferase [Amycolatopsis sp. cmx-11-12]|uniref:activator-dependent family glycosyltransferase n=1 Tax=Amycolatopsis sp. cmx-11-12 TaxID=2785795 RepID=UPI003917FBCA